MNRRKFLTVAGMSSLYPCLQAMAEPDKSHQYKIGITDWHINAKGDPKAFQLASEFGLDGIQLSYIPTNKTNNLTEPAVREKFLAESVKHKVEIASMAMGIFNQRPFMTEPDAEKWVTQCLEFMPELKQKVVLMAFFGKGDMKDKPEMQKLAIERLKRLAPIAEKKGMTLGLETWLGMEDHMRILDAVGSNAVKVFYDTANMDKMGYDILKEIRWLGKKNAICQIHLKENGNRLGQGKVDFPKVKEALQDINYKDWLIIESAIKNGWKESAQANGKYLKTLFNGA
jgi:sugar phosphate isomerase/epimerase